MADSLFIRLFRRLLDRPSNSTFILWRDREGLREGGRGKTVADRQRLLWKHQKNDADDNDNDEYRQNFRLVHFRSATSSMRKPLPNSPAAPIQSSAIRRDFISLTSSLVEAFQPFSKFAFTEAPLATDFESRQFFALDHTVRGSLADLQHGSGFFESQKTQRRNVVFFHSIRKIEQRQCHDRSKYSRPFIGKSSSVGGPKSTMG